MAGPTTAQRPDRPAPPPWRSAPGPRRRGPLNRRAVLAGLLALCLLAGAGGYLFYGSSWLQVRRVRVSGTRVLTPDQVRAAAGVRAGEPLVSVDTGAVAARLRAALPRIDAVRVTRSWPDAVEVSLTERTPRALVEKGGKFVEVDGRGVRYATESTPPPGVPRVQLTGGAAKATGYFRTEVLLHAAVQVAADLPESVHGRTKAIRVGSFDGVVLELAGGRSVLWGSPEDGPRKAAALTALLRADPGAVHYDVSAPSAPAASGS